MPKLSKERRQQQRQRIIDATVAMALERGIANVSMADIIKASGMSAGAIYGYFPSKEDVFLAMAEQVLRHRRMALNDVMEQEVIPSPQELFPTMVYNLVESGAGLVLQVWGYALGDERIREVVGGLLNEGLEALEKYLAAWYRQEGREDMAASAGELASAAFAMAQGMLVQNAIGGVDPTNIELGLKKMLE
ncbi:TetR/AcrR family transcriptional regulator [Corynebacterium lowii]|nr:TetR/AcrR family transcriptional regulator [Corynebacterium lowii]MDP9852672.1 AcrR family transcriptional regulator [Corynebacterium lowii]